MDEQRYLYVSDWKKHEVRRYQLGEKNGTLVAGGNGRGNGLNQLNYPTYLFVDRQQNVYVSDNENHRVMKWVEGAKEGIVIAGGQGEGDALTQLYYPLGLFVDTLGTLYVADQGNDRVMRWTQGAKQGTVIVGGNGPGAGANQFNVPVGLSFDRHVRRNGLLQIHCTKYSSKPKYGCFITLINLYSINGYNYYSIDHAYKTRLHSSGRITCVNAQVSANRIGNMMFTSNSL
ncbi:unnamed protein product [Rotaria magnacalcarata]|uniref:Uncharacterized protein n=1 Tax=Rotaria magnacalcarata TaxID=392030 RepID=A0A816LV87_9BILA|nr:unnamed protein product [Rotaria magnacalcarata]